MCFKDAVQLLAQLFKASVKVVRRKVVHCVVSRGGSWSQNKAPVDVIFTVQILVVNSGLEVLQVGVTASMLHLMMSPQLCAILKSRAACSTEI